MIHELKLYCFSGTYTKKCEELLIKLEVFDKIAYDSYSSNNIEDKDILTYIKNIDKFDLTTAASWESSAEIQEARGQASSCVVNYTTCYLFFGYDCKHQSITTIEKFDGILWEAVPYANTSNISSLLYYHSNLVVSENEVLVFGGMREIDEYDHVYCFNMEKKELSKDALFNKGFYRFQNEKCFTEVSPSINSLVKESGLGKVSDKILNVNDIEKESGKNTNNILDASVSLNGTFALFDYENNVHLFKEKGREYLIVPFANLKEGKDKLSS
mmetsp:Transcript_31783/g.33009  ORF Transcript_31783/g.33009 Transcript_31783/m.33009 type:complete len:271 (+) Transcript_31783:2-814(+)